jgi:hypothetical protein
MLDVFEAHVLDVVHVAAFEAILHRAATCLVTVVDTLALVADMSEAISLVDRALVESGGAGERVAVGLLTIVIESMIASGGTLVPRSTRAGRVWCETRVGPAVPNTNTLPRWGGVALAGVRVGNRHAASTLAVRADSTSLRVLKEIAQPR